MKSFDFSTLNRVNPIAQSCSAQIRTLPEYFQVEEALPFELDGSGGHVWLYICKRGINTEWLSKELARFAGVANVAVGFAGLKDRHAVTYQWFSVNLEGHDEPDWSAFETEDVQIIKQVRHNKKLKRGALSGNHFKLRITDITGDKADWQHSLEMIQQQGVPNYYAEQRFGHNGMNLHHADNWFTHGRAPRKRNQRSIYLSAARSWLFNLVLSQRIERQSWNKTMSGDVMLLDGTRSSYFHVDAVNADIEQRLDSFDIHPTGPLWGRGNLPSSAQCNTLEQAVLADWQDWQLGLEKAGLNQERRSLRLHPQQFSWQFIDDAQLELQFFLPSGCYATAVLRELAEITDAQQRNYEAEKSLTQ